MKFNTEVINMMTNDIKIDNMYAAFALIEILFEKGLINNETYINVNNKYKSHILQLPDNSI